MKVAIFWWEIIQQHIKLIGIYKNNKNQFTIIEKAPNNSKVSLF